MTCHVRLHSNSLLSQISTNYILENKKKKITINKLNKKIILFKKIMITKYVKHTNQKVHRWNLVTKPKTQTIFLSLKSNRNFILELALKFL